MPVDLPNPKLFKPYIPKAMNKHFLFGTKFFKVHQFRDPKWGPENITDQYGLIVTCLKRNMRYKKLKLASLLHKQVKTVQHLKEECTDGRTRLRRAYLGDLTIIRNILIKRKDLQRKFKGMPLSAIMESCDQATFLKRKENDRLKHQIKLASTRLKEVTIEESKIEDRLKYANEFVLQAELDAKVYRKDLKNSQTRIEAYKLIARTYQKILALMQRDDVYFESILDAIEGDIIEQQNFIEQIVVLGSPAISEYKELGAEFMALEDETRAELNEHTAFIAHIRKQVTNLQKETKTVVRNYVPTKVHTYVRTTPSMAVLQSDIDELDTIINEIRLVTMSPAAETIQTTLEHLVRNVNYFDKQNKIDEKYKEILSDKYDQAIAQKHLLYNNYSPVEAERLQTIEDLKLEVSYQKKVRMQCDQQIVNSGNMSQILNFSLNNIVDVLRHVGKRLDPVAKDYPTFVLKLPLLKFDFFNILSIPPIEVNRNSKKLLDQAKEKIRILTRAQLYKPKLDQEEAELNIRLYHIDYMRTLEDEDSVGGRLSEGGSGDNFFDIVLPDGNILTRAKLKYISAKIVEKNAKKEDDFT